MTEEEREVIQKAVSLVLWQRKKMLERDPYGTSNEKVLVEAVDKMKRVANSDYGGFDWRVVQTVTPLQENCTWERRNHSVYGPDAWDHFFFKLICRCESEREAVVVAACLDGLECDQDGNPWPHE